MNVPAAPALVQVFIRILGLRGWIAAGFLLLAAAGVYGALQIPTDSAIERLIVADDPDSRAARDFERLFPEGEHALLMLEAPDPLSPAVLRAADHLQRKLAQLQHVQAHSILSFFRRTNPAAELTEDQTSRLRKFATGPTLLRRAGLFGGPHTGVSAPVPLTVLVTTTATLVYIHARFVDRQDSRPLVEHHARALANKFLPCTAS